MVVWRCATICLAFALRLCWNRVDRTGLALRVEQLEKVGVGGEHVFPPKCGVVGWFEMHQGIAKLGEKNWSVNGRMAVAAEKLVSRHGQIAVEIVAGRERVKRQHFEYY